MIPLLRHGWSFQPCLKPRLFCPGSLLTLFPLPSIRSIPAAAAKMRFVRNLITNLSEPFDLGLNFTVNLDLPVFPVHPPQQGIFEFCSRAGAAPCREPVAHIDLQPANSLQYKLC